jgi:type II secretory pathway pseudopilin PulG
MILTLGGLGIWSLIDFIIIAMGRFTDSDGRLINRPCNLAVVLIFAIGAPVFFGILAAIAIPQYARYRRGAQESRLQSSYHAIALAEEAYFATHDRYSASIETLSLDVGLVLDPMIIYSDPVLYTGDRYPCFKFRVRHVSPGVDIYDYDSCADVTVTTTPTRGY